jgi:hypothetical protein
MSGIDPRGEIPLVPPVVLYDRRKSPDRRESWRGGRRDSDWINRPPGALRRFEKLQRRVVQLGRWRVPVPFTGTGRRVHPFVGLWALVIVGIMAFAAAKTNFLLLGVLFETIAPNPQLSTPSGIVTDV